MESVITKVAEIAYRVNNKALLKNPEYFDTALTGKIIGFTPFEMCYLALEIMTEFNISLEKDDIENYHFNSIRSIAERIEQKLN